MRRIPQSSPCDPGRPKRPLYAMRIRYVLRMNKRCLNETRIQFVDDHRKDGSDKSTGGEKLGRGCPRRISRKQTLLSRAAILQKTFSRKTNSIRITYETIGWKVARRESSHAGSPASRTRRQRTARAGAITSAGSWTTADWHRNSSKLTLLTQNEFDAYYV